MDCIYIEVILIFIRNVNYIVVILICTVHCNLQNMTRKHVIAIMPKWLIRWHVFHLNLTMDMARTILTCIIMPPAHVGLSIRYHNLNFILAIFYHKFIIWPPWKYYHKLCNLHVWFFIRNNGSSMQVILSKLNTLFFYLANRGWHPRESPHTQKKTAHTSKKKALTIGKGTCKNKKKAHTIGKGTCKSENKTHTSGKMWRTQNSNPG